TRILRHGPSESRAGRGRGPTPGRADRGGLPGGAAARPQGPLRGRRAGPVARAAPGAGRAGGAAMSTAGRRVLPAFSLSLGYTLTYLGLLVLLPLAACFLKAASLSWPQFWAAVWTERARAAYALTLETSLVAAAANAVLGFLVAWVLVRYDFPLKRLF